MGGFQDTRILGFPDAENAGTLEVHMVLSTTNPPFDIPSKACYNEGNEGMGHMTHSAGAISTITISIPLIIASGALVVGIPV